MTSRSAHFAVDTAALKPTEALGCVARAGVAVGLTAAMFHDLATEVGGHDAACRWLIDLATETNRPITVNVSTGKDTSTTTAIAPKSWTEERLRGWAGGMHEELEEQFGPAELRPPGGGEPRRPGHEWGREP